MIACNCCPTPAGCKEYGDCLNAKVVQLQQAGKWPFPAHETAPVDPVAWANIRATPYKSAAPVWIASTPSGASPAWDMRPAVVKPSCWHDFGPTATANNGIVTARACLHCG